MDLNETPRSLNKAADGHEADGVKCARGNQRLREERKACRRKATDASCV